VAGSAKRERQLAREHYERQQERRRASADRRRKVQQGAAVALGVLLVVGGLVGLAVALNGNEDSTVGTQDTSSAEPTNAESQSPTPSATEGAGCTYSTTQEPAAKDVGLPPYDASHPEQYEQPFAATLVTNRGNITVEMAAAEAPCTTNSFRHLATEGYFDGGACHRLTTSNIFVLQCGDPTGSGSGGPGYQFPEENLPEDAENNYPAGTVAMANAGPGTNGSQFFLVYDDTTLPPDYTIFGTVTEGLDVVQDVADAGVAGGGGDGQPEQKVTIENVRIAGEG
jgi:peptidyl-prolyl cis-trans isomerase B (cyclophilin B)